jgi:hypothetical protein
MTKHHKKPLHKKVIEVLKKPIHKIVAPKRHHAKHKPEATLPETAASETVLPLQTKPADTDVAGDAAPPPEVTPHHEYSSGYVPDADSVDLMDAQSEDESSAFWKILLWCVFVVGLGVAAYFVFRHRFDLK